MDPETSLISILEGAVAIVDSNGRVLQCNAEFTDMMAEEMDSTGTINIVDRLENPLPHGTRAQMDILPKIIVLRCGETVLQFTVKRFETNDGQTAYLCQEARAQRATDTRLRFLIDHLDQGFWDFDARSDSFTVTSKWRTMRGLAPNDRIPGRDAASRVMVHPDDQEKFNALFANTDGQTLQTVSIQYRCRHRDGHWFWILCRGRVIERDAQGVPKRVLGSDIDITDLKQEEEDRLQLASKFELALQVSGIGIWESDPAEDYVYCDDRFLEMYGITDGQNLQPKKMWKQYADPDQSATLGANADENIRLGKDINMDYKIKRDDGTTRWLRCIARLVTSSTNRARLIGVNIDVTRDYENAAELENARIKMEHDARHDALTGLANRRLLDETVDFLFDELKPTDRYAVLHLDLDHFKQINDTLGHAAGDSVLIKVANDLLSVLSADQLVCRVGGDEFVVLFPKAPGKDELAALSQTILETAKKPFFFEGNSCKYGISVGIAVAQGPTRLSSEIFSNADLALYEAKRAGRGVYRFYSPDLRSSNDSQLKERRELADAIKNNEITFFLQPKFDASSFAFVGAEALVRWQCPRRGLLEPREFMPLAEASALTAQIDECVLAQVLAVQTRWSDAGMRVPHISVNVSGQRLAQEGLRKQLKANLNPHHALSLELLETIFLDEVNSEFKRNLATAREMGVGLELDDFGSGRSSIIALQTIAPDCVKIDQSLTRPILERPAQLHILKALSQIAKSENINVTLEGMETLGHVHAIKDVNCDTLQGFALSHPMDVPTFENFLKNGASLTWPNLIKSGAHPKSA